MPNQKPNAITLNLCPDCGVPPRFYIYSDDGSAECDCFYVGCESYNVKHAESWQEALAQWNENTAKAYAERPESPISYNGEHEPAAVENRPQNGLECDTREKLERDIKAEYYMLADEELEPIFGWLDRQAAITEQECQANAIWAWQERYKALNQVAELTAERDELRERVRKLTMKTMAMEDKRKIDSERWTKIAHQHQEDLHEIMELREKLREKQHVCDVQRDSFAKLERDNAKLRDTLARVRGLVGDAE